MSICDLDFDIVLLSNEINQVKQPIQRVKTECGKVGLGLHVKKSLFFNVDVEPKKLQ